MRAAADRLNVSRAYVEKLITSIDIDGNSSVIRPGVGKDIAARKQNAETVRFELTEGFPLR